MNILLLSAYHAHSHQQWARQLMQQFPEYHWQLLSLPPRFYSWRIRGNSLIWKCREEDTLKQSFDLIIATSMTDLNSLYGFFPHLATAPSILYFHENQFAYPISNEAITSIEAQIVQLYSAITAGKLVFNSDYNRQTFFAGLSELLNKLPDDLPANLVSDLAKKAQVLPVPIKNEWFVQNPDKFEHFSIVWNHRWEYDKWPECFFNAMQSLLAQNIPFELYVLGQQFRQVPPIFAEMHKVLATQIKHWGWIEDETEYRQLLSKCHVAVSTAKHDFQGLAMLEAQAAGVYALVPNRLAYPEWFDANQRYASAEQDLELQVSALSSHLRLIYDDFRQKKFQDLCDLSSLSWNALKPEYKNLLES